MSGPKSSSYEIERRKQEQLRKEMEVERLKKLEEEACRSLEQQITSAKNSLNAAFQKLKAYYTSDEAGYITRTGNILDSSLRRRIERKSGSLKTYLDEISGLTANLRKEIAFKEKLLLQEKLFENKAVDSASTVYDNITLNTGNSAGTHSLINLAISGPVGGASEKDDDNRRNMAGELSELYISANEYLASELVLSKKALGDLLASVEDIAGDKVMASDYKLSQILMRKRAFIAMKNGMDKEITANKKLLDEFEALKLEYVSLCGMLGEREVLLSFDASNGKSLVAQLSGLVNQKKEQLEKKENSDFASTAIYEVMQELGYRILATDQMQTPKRNVTHDIYDFDGENVINVFTSDNGSLMLEVSGVKSEAAPDFCDKAKIKEAMENFCPQYDVIRQKLRERGIYLSNEQLLPPDEMYAMAVELKGKKAKSDETIRRINDTNTMYMQ